MFLLACVVCQVNAYFELSSNRRDIWYGSDMTGDGAVRSSWNVSLLEDIIAPCYVRFIVTASLSLGPTAQYYSLWPCDHGAGSSSRLGVLQEPWSLVKQRFFLSLADKPVVFTCAGRRWLAPRDAVLCASEDLEAAEGPARVSLPAWSPVEGALTLVDDCRYPFHCLQMPLPQRPLACSRRW